MPEARMSRVLITGAAAGIGLAITRRLSSDGIALALADKDTAGLERVAQDIANAGQTAIVIPGDIRDAATIEATVAAAGDLDGLVNCAGIYPVASMLDIDAEEWDRVLDLNLRTPFLLTRAAAKHMIAAGRGGAIVNISSTASVLARPGIAHYAASKAGLNQLTRVLAVELAPHGIRVNAVLPGVIGTETVRASQSTPEAVAEMAAKLARIPMRRLGTPEEIAELVASLLPRPAPYAPGALFPADGGFPLGIAAY